MNGRGCGGYAAAGCAGGGPGGCAAPQVPSLETPGYLWERWRTPHGGVVEIVGERPRPAGSRHRGSIGVIWQCSQCTVVAGERRRLAGTRSTAAAHLLLHVIGLDPASATPAAHTAGQPARRPAGPLPAGWAPQAAKSAPARRPGGPP